MTLVKCSEGGTDCFQGKAAEDGMEERIVEVGVGLEMWWIHGLAGGQLCWRGMYLCRGNREVSREWKRMQQARGE